MYPIKQSTTAQPLVFYLVASSDHIAALTGATPTVTIRKVGGSFASPSGAVTEIANGWYQVAGNATDTNTLGPLLLHATAASGDPTDVCYHVVAYDPQDAVRAGLTALPNAAANAAGGLPVSIAGALDLDEMNVDIEAIQTSTAGLTYTVANQVDANVLDWKSAVAPAMTGDAFARLGAPVGASISADIAEIEAETDLIGTDTAGVTTLLTRIPGTVQPQTGDSYARLGAPVGASISADIAEVEADVDLLGAAADPWATAVPGAYGAGTAGNILGNRLDVAVSTRATSAGAGGAGSRQVTITVDKPDTVTPLGSCAVWVSTDAAGTNVVAGTLYTNDSTGQVQFMLDNGSYYYWRQHPAYTFTNPVAITVS